MALGFVDLFAGCGGLSLGLEQSGFEPVFVSELHPDAMGTYLQNRRHLKHDLSDKRRNVLDILTVTRKQSSVEDVASFLRAEHGEIALVVGGPPCQGFSGIGHRRTFQGVTKKDIPSNHLYRDMAAFVDAIQPRAFVFENVRGLLSSRWSPNGDKGEIWNDVLSTFLAIGSRKGKRPYRIGWQLLYAKDYGVPQNRPRVVMIGIREDINWKPESVTAAGFLPDPTRDAPDLVDLLGDLVDPDWVGGGTTTRYTNSAQTKQQRLLRRDMSGRLARRGEQVTEMEYSNHSDEVTAKFRYMLNNGGRIPPRFQTKKFAQRLLPARWGSEGPTITATSLPDDYVHFSQPRVLTVREWARLQMFPDWYQFSGKRTTGGRRRAGDPSKDSWDREVPKYTQIGNAVPVGLAAAIGCHLREIIS